MKMHYRQATSFNFIRSLHWNNMEKELEAIPDSFFRFRDVKKMKKKLFQCMETNLFFTNSIHKFQSVIHFMTARLKIRDKMARIQNVEDALKGLDFKTQTNDVEIRKPYIKEEFIIVIAKIQNSIGKSAYRINFGGIFVQIIAAARVYSDHFTNMAVYAVVIGDIIDTTRRMFH